MIPFTRPYVTNDEIPLIREAIENCDLSGDGAATRKCHQLLENVLEVPKALLTTSCTHALEMSALLLRIKPGDEVILPSFTFVSTANAFFLHGAKPVFVDIREDTLNLDEKKLPQAITERTRAIIPVHYAGVGCEMDTILSLANAHGIAVVEDNAHGLFGKYKGRYLGTLGAMATQSFHETKNFTCGEGGALLINDPSYIERAEIIREKGTDRSLFYRGKVDKYTWRDVGSSYLPSGILAAFLCAQLRHRQDIQGLRKHVFEYYQEALSEWATEQRVRLPIIPPECEQTYHMFYMLMPSSEDRTELLAYLKERGIQATFHYVPLHTSDIGRDLGYQKGQFPVTESVSERLLRLPFYNRLTEEELKLIVDAVRSFRTRRQ